MAVRPWVPTDAQGVTVREFDPSVSGTLTLSGSSVTAIASKDGTLTASAVGTNYPTLDSAALNGFPALVFTGAQDLLTAAFTQGPNWAAFVAVSPSALSGTQYVLDADQRANTGGNQRIAEYIRFNSTNVQSLGFAANQSNTSLASAAYGAANTPRIVGTTYPANNTVSLSLDGGTPVAATAAADSATGSVPLAIGGSANGVAGLFRGSVGYAGLVLGVLSSGDYDRYVGYLAWRFNLQGNLPAGHPYKNAAPTIDAGGTDATATGATLTASSAFIAGSASGTKSATGAGTTLTAASALIPGTASGTKSATAAGATLTSASAFVPGSATAGGSATANGAVFASAASLVAGTATGAASATAPGGVVSAVAAFLPGGPATNATAAGSTLSCAPILLPGAATAATNATAAGGTLTVAPVFIPGTVTVIPNPYPYITPDVLLSGSLVGPVTLRGQMQPDLITLQARLRN